MKQRTIIWSSIVLCASAAGCAGKAFVRVDPPAAVDGVSVALTQEQCALESDPLLPDTFDLDLDLTMRVTDSANDALKFHPEKSRLIIAGHENPSDDRADEVGVSAGGKKDLHVHFLVKGRDIACNNAMSLALDKAMELGGKPLKLSPVSFQPSSSPDS
jgi:hypothetical protein